MPPKMDRRNLTATSSSNPSESDSHVSMRTRSQVQSSGTGMLYPGLEDRVVKKGRQGNNNDVPLLFPDMRINLVNMMKKMDPEIVGKLAQTCCHINGIANYVKNRPKTEWIWELKGFGIQGVNDKWIDMSRMWKRDAAAGGGPSKWKGNTKVPKTLDSVSFLLVNMDDEGLAVARDVIKSHKVTSIRVFEMGAFYASTAGVKEFIEAANPEFVQGSAWTTTDVLCWIFTQTFGYIGIDRVEVKYLLQAKNKHLDLRSTRLSNNEMIEILQTWLKGDINMDYWRLGYRGNFEDILKQYHIYSFTYDGELPDKRPLVFRKSGKEKFEFTQQYFYIVRNDEQILELTTTAWRWTTLAKCDGNDMPDALKK